MTVHWFHGKAASNPRLHYLLAKLIEYMSLAAAVQEAKFIFKLLESMVVASQWRRQASEFGGGGI
jgi:hypothetical protein